MLKGEWRIDSCYKRGDIVNITNKFDFVVSKRYYICALSHVSDGLINPRNKEEIYWIEVKNMSPYERNPIPYGLRSKYNPKRKIIYEESENIKKRKKVQEPEQEQEQEQELEQERELEQETQEEIDRKQLKRKIVLIESEIIEFKKKRKLKDDSLELKDQIMLSAHPMETKIFLLDKYNNLSGASGSDYAKGKTWIKTVLNLPIGKYTPFGVTTNDSYDKINEYFRSVRAHLDNKIHKMDNVKDEIMEYLARKISNPESKGHVLALCGSAGVGKTKVLSSLAEALQLPFHQINFGGLNDASVLIGHSETYVSSKPGKFVEIINNSNCMNPIIFCDEIDKISENKGREINGILTHVLDEEQNYKFQDNYLSSINIDLSKVFFVIAFNDIEKVDRIVSDRMKVIYIDPPSVDDKVIIASKKMIPEIIKSLNIKRDKYINLDQELLKYIISSKVQKEDGVRQLRKSLEKLFNKINYLLLTGNYKESNLKITYENIIDSISLIELSNSAEVVNITKSFIDNCLESKGENTSYLHMYL